MTDQDRAEREDAGFATGSAGLDAATAGVSGSLDLNTVLCGIAASARRLTGARYGAIAVTDETGGLLDFVTSGFTEEERRRLVEWPYGPRVLEHFRDLDAPVRVADTQAFVRSLGFPTDRLPFTSFQGAPMHHRGARSGSFFLGGKAGGEAFAANDEEVLVLFAAQAATAVALARTYRAERRAHGEAEALVRASAVGVAVFDASTRNVVSLNREAKRILDTLRMPDGANVEVPEKITCRFADGRETSLDRLLRSQETARANMADTERIVLSTPHGKNVATLVNVSAIPAADGGAASFVVTMRDLAPLQELGRTRADFLRMVSHELRAPLTSIKGSTSTVLGNSRRFGSDETLQFFRIIDDQADHLGGLISDLLDAGRIETDTLSVSPEPSELKALVDQARTAFLGAGGKQPVVVDLPLDLPRVMADRPRILQVLNNLLSNAGRHSSVSSPIRVHAEQGDARVAVSVSDQGSGIPPDQLPHLFGKYSGAGREGGGFRRSFGLAICRSLIEAHGGRIWASSPGVGGGSCFTFTIPMADRSEMAATAPGGGPVNRRALPQGKKRAPILVVDDDPHALGFVRDVLEAKGYSVTVAADHRELSGLIRGARPQLVLLDLMFPGTDGIELLQEVPELAELPVVFISAYRRDETIARALEAGAVDYLAKPFSPIELIARVRAALRGRALPDTFVLRELTIDYDRRHVTLAGRPIGLTATEYRLLVELSVGAGRVLTYEALLRKVWSRRRYGDRKIVRAFVKRLRQKLQDNADAPAYILTERGVGYRMPGPDVG